MTEKLIIFDTTLRDGEQSPGASMTQEEKVRIALQLEKLTERFSCQLVIKIGADCSDNQIETVLASLDEFKGNSPVLLAAAENGSEVYIKSRKYAVQPDFALLNSLKELLGESSAYLRPINKRENYSQ